MSVREEIQSKIQDYEKIHDGKKPSKIHITPEKERQLEAEFKKEKGGDLTAEEAKKSIREIFPTIDGIPVEWDATDFTVE